MSKNVSKVVLAYSGGMDTTVILKWLIEAYQCEVVTVTCDLGQEEELAGIDEKAKSCGASQAYILDVREEFASDFIFPMFRANAMYEGRYLLGTSIARPLIAKCLVDIAKKEGADAISHGATGKGNDQVRFEVSASSLAPQLKAIAPWREWDLRSRTDLQAFCTKHGIPLKEKAKHYSMDRNMLHLSYEGGELEDPWLEASDESYTLTVPPEQAPDKAEYIEIDFEQGNAVALNGTKYSPAGIIRELNTLGGKHAVGRIDMVENRFVGMKARGVYEAPGATIIHAAHRDLEGICLDREVMRQRDSLIPNYAAMIYNGFWYSPERETLQTYFDATQQRVTGTVKLKLYKGNVYPVARKSPFSLFRHDLATFERDEVYDQAKATGFIMLNSLRVQGYKAK